MGRLLQSEELHAIYRERVEFIQVIRSSDPSQNWDVHIGPTQYVGCYLFGSAQRKKIAGYLFDLFERGALPPSEIRIDPNEDGERSDYTVRVEPITNDIWRATAFSAGGHLVYASRELARLEAVSAAIAWANSSNAAIWIAPPVPDWNVGAWNLMVDIRALQSTRPHIFKSGK
ncbi:hypothetical protein G3545_13795 [Starkeya sp. ORNL1]|uniref:hypothetical protein n=1 Tax=Starkeya sp. ORNL1 TaxID=2709380 RepID=UPI0014635C81|nr:hypothetical protein [Starkeya sp. ORNL1]QJP14623.1 hypothetical protein G3545_13795 [Starkeya sp. ORNL1]